MVLLFPLCKLSTCTYRVCTISKLYITLFLKNQKNLVYSNNDKLKKSGHICLYNYLFYYIA